MDPDELSSEQRERFEELPEKLQEAISRVSSKRGKLVIRLILEQGSVSTQEIDERGYDHPPRAARDVREAGVPLDTNMVTDEDGNRMGAYVFGDPEEVEAHKAGGRSTLPKELKDELYKRSVGQCYICGRNYEKRYLQVDHRVPYEIVGEAAEPSQVDEFMLLCGSCQRSKSYSCENCPNWTDKDEDTCRSCYWFSPQKHTHVATAPVRRLDITFDEGEIEIYERLRHRSEELGISVQELVKRTLQ